MSARGRGYSPQRGSGRGVIDQSYYQGGYGPGAPHHYPPMRANSPQTHNSYYSPPTPPQQYYRPQQQLQYYNQFPQQPFNNSQYVNGEQSRPVTAPTVASPPQNSPRRQPPSARKTSQDESFDAREYIRNIVEAYHAVEDCSQILNQSSLPYAKVVLENDGSDVEDLNAYGTDAPFSCTWRFKIYTTSAASLKYVSFLCRDSKHMRPFSFVHADGHQLPGMRVVFGDCFSKRPGIYEVRIQFNCFERGIYKQWVCFDFTGQPPYIARQIHVFVGDESDPAFQVEKFRFETTVAELEWNSSTVEIVVSDWPAFDRELIARQLLARWKPLGAALENDALELRTDSYGPDNFKRVMHGLIRLEQAAVSGVVGRLFIDAPLMTVAHSPDGMSLEGFIMLGEALDPKTRMGSLTLKSASRMLLAFQDYVQQIEDDGLRRVYEADIMEKKRGITEKGAQGSFYSIGVRLRLSQRCVLEQQLVPGSQVRLHQARFQITCLPFAEWHDAVEKVSCDHILFPQIDLNIVSPLDPRQVDMDSQVLDPKLLKNPGQCNVVRAILAKPKSTNITGLRLPPIVVQGAFGTGKTFTFAQTIKLLLNQSRSQPGIRIVLCTMSNSAADLYIKNYLHPFLTQMRDSQVRGPPGAGRGLPRIFRVYKSGRDPSTLSPEVLAFCRLQPSMMRPGHKEFAPVAMSDVMASQLVITNLVGAMDLSRLCLPNTTFSHVFLDEAAQSFEADTLKALCLVGPQTRVIMAGDPRQMAGGTVQCPILKRYGFDRALIDRLVSYYSKDWSTFGRLGYGHVLETNYRCHPKIMEFIRANFYPDLRNMRNEYVCEFTDYFPFRFYDTDTAGGVEQFHQESTTFYNTKEAEEALKRVEELLEFWPDAFNEKDAAGNHRRPQDEIAVVCPYDAQVMLIQKLLSQKEETRVNVSHIQWIQGMEFRVIVMSTVRTIRPADDENYDLAFLSDPRLLNTAITRAKSAVFVIGSAKTLTTVGPCAKIWQSLIYSCKANHTFFSATATARDGMPAALNREAASMVGRNLIQSRFDHVTVVPDYVEQQMMMLQSRSRVVDRQEDAGVNRQEARAPRPPPVALTDHETAEMKHRYPKFVDVANNFLEDSANVPLAWGAATSSRMVWLHVIGTTEYYNNIKHTSNLVNRDEANAVVDLVRRLPNRNGNNEILVVCSTAAQAAVINKLAAGLPRERITVIDIAHPLPPQKQFAYLVMSFVRTTTKSMRALVQERGSNDRVSRAKGVCGDKIIDMELVSKVLGTASSSGIVAFVGNCFNASVFPAWDWLYRRLSQQNATFERIQDLMLQQPAQSG